MKHTLILIFTIFGQLLQPFPVYAEELKVGVILGLTGHASLWADYSRKGLELALSEVNTGTGPKGKTLKLIYEDSQATASGAVSAFQKLVHQKKVGVVVGDVWAFLTIPLIPLAAREQIVLISPTVMKESVSDINSYYFSMGHRFESLHEAFRTFFILNPRIKQAGTISVDDYWNDSYIKAFREVAQEKGVKIVKSMKLNDFNTDFRTEVTAIKHARADMLLSTWKPEVALQRMREQYYQVPYLCSSDAVEAVLFRSKNRALFEGMYFVDWKPSEEFARKFRAQYGTEPLYEAQNSYEVIRAISKAAELDNPDFRAALSQVTYDGVNGRIDFKASQFPNMNQARLYKVHQGAFVEQVGGG